MIGETEPSDAAFISTSPYSKYSLKLKEIQLYKGEYCLTIPTVYN